MGRRAFIAFALVALLAIAGLFLRDGEGNRSKSLHQPSTPSAAQEPGDDLVDEQSGVAVEELELEFAAAPAGRAESRPVAAEEPPTSPTPAEVKPGILQIEVVDGTTLAPVLDAEVWYLARSGPLRKLALDRLGNSVPSYLPSMRTDKNGLVRIEVEGSTSVEVIARIHRRQACADFDAPGAEQGERHARLILLPDWDLTVEVVGDDSAPVAGIPVVLQVPSDTSSWGKIERTDSRGRVYFPHAGYQIEREPGEIVRVAIQLPLTEKVEAIVEREPPAGEPVRLRLPPLGSVEVRVIDKNGAPVENDVNVTLRPVRPGESRELSLSWEGGLHRTSTSGSRALFEQVGLGLELELTAEPFGKPQRARSFVPGPHSRGERVTTTLELALEGTVLRFRAVDEKGQPVVGKLEVTTYVHSRFDRSSHGTERSTDSEGRFEVTVEALPDGEQRGLDVTAYERWGARVDLSRSFPTGSIEMGDLVLAALPLIVEGQVVDGGRRPVAGALVTVASPPPEEGSDAWRSPQPLSGTRKTDDEGTFSLWGFAEHRSVRLWAGSERQHASPIVVPVGSTGVELVLQETGGVSGGLLVDRGVPPGSLRVELRREGAPRRDGATFGGRQVPVASQGSFRCEGMLSGTYSLVVAVLEEVLVEVPGLVISPGEIAQDPRIQAIDLRGRLHVFTLSLVAPSSSFEMIGGLSYTEAGTSGPVHTFGFREAPLLQVVTPLPHIDATLSVVGCRKERLANLGERSEVRLRPGFPVRLALSNDFILPSPPLHLGVTLVDEKGERGFAEDSLFDARGELVLHVPEPGRMRVRWFVEHNYNGSGSRSDIEMPDEQIVVVEDQVQEQRVELALTNEKLAAALAKR